MDNDISIEIARLYVTFFNRAPDPDGLQYWMDRYATEVSNGAEGDLFLEEVADSFAQSPEATTIYEQEADPSRDAIDAYITEAYFNMFGRTPDQEGLNYWAGRWETEMDAGRPGVRVLFEIENAARGSSNQNDIDALNNKAAVAAKFTNDFIESGATWTQEDMAKAQTIVDDVDHTDESVEEANADIDAYVEVRSGEGEAPEEPGSGDGRDTTPPNAPALEANIDGELVTITGTAEVGSTVRIFVDGEQYKEIVATNGAFTTTYTLPASEQGEVTFSAIATDAAGNVSAASIAEVDFDTRAADVAGVVTVAGEAEVGQTLSASLSDANGAPDDVIFEWSVDGKVVEGTTGSTYTITSSDFGREITVSAAYVDALGYANTASMTTERVDVDYDGVNQVILFNPGSEGGQGYINVMQALNAAEAGAEIYVRSGTYAELTEIRDPGVSLLGAPDAALTGGVYFTTLAEGSSIDGFKISGSTSGAAVNVRAHDVTISNNLITRSDVATDGIETIHGITGLDIAENTISGFTGYGIYLNSNSGAVITGNDFGANRYGVMAQDGEAPTVTENEFTGSELADIGYWAYRGTEPVNLSTAISGNTHSGTAQDVRVLASGNHNIIGTDEADHMFEYSIVGPQVFDGGLGADVITGGLGTNTVFSSAGGDTYIATEGETINFEFRDTDHSGFGRDVTTFDFTAGTGQESIPLNILLSGEDFVGAGDLLNPASDDYNPMVASFGIGREGSLPMGPVENFFMMQDNDHKQADPGFPLPPAGSQSLVVYLHMGEDRYNVYFDANGNGDLDVGDGQIEILGLNHAGVAWATSGPAG